jgi:hypothetical protein
MRKALIGIMLAAVALLCRSSMAQVVNLPNGTPIKLKLSETLRCENSHQGDSISFEVVNDVKIDGVIVIAQGALAYGRIVDGTTWARRVGKGGRVALEVKSVTDVTGRQTPIAEDRYIQGRGRGTEITLGTVAAPSPLWLLWEGKHTKFPEGQIFVAVTTGDKVVDLTQLALNTKAEPAAVRARMPEKPAAAVRAKMSEKPENPSTPQFAQAVPYPLRYTVNFDSPTLVASARH